MSEKQMLHDIALEARRNLIHEDYQDWFDEMLATAKRGKFSVIWPSDEEHFPEELAEYLFLDLNMTFFYLSSSKQYCGSVVSLIDGWRNKAPYIEVSWK